MKTAVKNTILFLVVTLAFFVVGFGWKDVTAAGFDRDALRIAFTGILDRVDNLTAPAIQEQTGELPVRQVFQETLNTIREKYYPGASTLSTTVIKTPTNAIKGQVVAQQPSLDVKQLTYMAIRGVLAALQDPFTGFLDPDDYKRMREENEGNFVGIGAQLWTNKKGQIYVKEPLPDCPAIKAGVRRGDIILKVDGIAVTGKDIDEVVKMIRGLEDTKVTLTLQRGKEAKVFTLTIVRKIVDYQMVESEMLDKEAGIAWLQLRQFNEKADQQLDKAMTTLEKQKMKGLILDLRSNPGGLLQSAVEIGSRFVKAGPIVIIQERGGQKTPLEVDPSRHDHKSVPLVVLIDDQSASASEIVAGAIKDTHAGTLVGVKTFGKGRVQTIVPLAPTQAAVRITTAKYLTPNGTDIHKRGIQPDVQVAMPEDLPEEDEDLENPNRLKNDPQLQKAVQVMREKLAQKGQFSQK